MLVLTQREVSELLPMSACLALMDVTLQSLARGDSVVPLRTVIRLPNESNAFASMPAFFDPTSIFAALPTPIGPPASRSRAIGAKVISIFPANHGTALDSHQGAVLLFDAENGSLLAVMDATAITAIRTAAVSAVATQSLSRVDADDLAILGSGVQARMHLEAIPLVREIRRARIWSRNKANAIALAAQSQEKHPFPIEVVDTAEQAAADASIICTTTSSIEPVLRGDWVSAGAHVNAVGSSTPRAREVDTSLVQRARLFVDSRVSGLSEAGDILIPIQEGAIGPDHILAELGAVLMTNRSGRETATEVTLFKSLGLAVEDVAAAVAVYEQAVEQAVGTVIDFGGVRDEAP